MKAGILPGSAEVNAHREALSEYFSINAAGQVSLGQMYEVSAGSSLDFAAYYEAAAPGLTAWLRQAIDARAVSLGVDPENAECG